MIRRLLALAARPKPSPPQAKRLILALLGQEGDLTAHQIADKTGLRLDDEFHGHLATLTLGKWLDIDDDGGVATYHLGTKGWRL